MTGFEYYKAASLDDAVTVLGRCDLPVCPVAGGTNIVANIRRGSQTPALLMDISGISELRGITETNDGRICLGALTTIKELAESTLISKKAHALHQAANQFADPTNRRIATVGGNLCNASPGADSAPPLLVYDAELIIQGQNSERAVPLEKFFTGSFKTALISGELLKQLEFTPREHSAFIKLGHRNSMAISITTVAVAYEKHDGVLKNCRIAYGASGPTPLRAYLTEKLFENRELSDDLFKEAEESLAEDLSPRDGLRGSLKYRRNVAGTLLRRAILCAC